MVVILYSLKLHKESTPIEFVLDMEPQEIALQVTLIDHALFCAIRVLSLHLFSSYFFIESDITELTLCFLFSYKQPHELLFQSWNKPHLRHKAPNVLSMISRTNNVCPRVSPFLSSKFD